MQLSYSVIKNKSVLTGSNRKMINTSYDIKPTKQEVFQVEENDPIVESYKNIGESIIKNANLQKERILEQVYADSQRIEREAYEKGYKQGLANGYEDGYKESYEKHMAIAAQEGLEIRNNATAMLMDAKAQYEEYMCRVKEEIINLAYTMAEAIVKNKLQREDGINHYLEEIIAKSRECKTFVIKCNEVHLNEVKSNVSNWKSQFALQGEIFVLADNTIEPGNAVVEKENGKVIVGLDIGLEKIKEQLF
jgi:flagellar assembly protein FliH